MGFLKATLYETSSTPILTGLIIIILSKESIFFFNLAPNVYDAL